MDFRISRKRLSNELPTTASTLETIRRGFVSQELAFREHFELFFEFATRFEAKRPILKCITDDNPESDKDLAGFQDAYPYLILGEDSLKDINQKINHKEYTMRTFRPNIVIQSVDGKPWAEDSWKGTLSIGDALLATASPCPRW